jgi:hypothetical protein
MEKLYRVVITEIDPETKAEKEVHVDELYQNVTLIADCADRNAMAEVVLNDNLIGIAAKLACGEKVKEAMKLAAVMTNILDDRAGKAENSLLRAIMGE